MKETGVFTQEQLTRKPQFKYSGRSVIPMAEPASPEQPKPTARIDSIAPPRRRPEARGANALKLQGEAAPNRDLIIGLQQYVTPKNLEELGTKEAAKISRKIAEAHARHDLGALQSALVQGANVLRGSQIPNGLGENAEEFQQSEGQTAKITNFAEAVESKNLRTKGEMILSIADNEERNKAYKEWEAELAQARMSALAAGASPEEVASMRAGDSQVRDKLAKNLVDINLAMNGGEEAGGQGYNIEKLLFPYKFTYSIAEDDMLKLISDPMSWQASQFDQVYEAVVKGNELSSQTVQAMEQNIGQGETYILYLRELATRDPYIGAILNPEHLTKILDDWEYIHATRINLMVGRSTYQQQNPEQVKERAAQLRAAGLFRAFALDDGRVGEMHNRFITKLKHKRDAEGGEQHYFSSAMMADLHNELIEEQLSLSRTGKGIFGERAQELRKNLDDENTRRRNLRRPNVKVFEQGEEFEKELQIRLKREIVRAERTGYDAGEISLQIADKVAKGKQPGDPTAYESSPSFLGYRMLNSQRAFLEKWNILGVEAREQMEESFIDVAETWIKEHRGNLDDYTRQQLVDKGEMIFFNKFTASDFYSSGWRKNKIFLQMENILAYRAENDALYSHIKDLPNEATQMYVIQEGIRLDTQREFQSKMIEEAGEKGWFPRGESGHTQGGRFHNNDNPTSYREEFQNMLNQKITQLLHPETLPENERLQPAEREKQLEKALRGGLTTISKGVRDTLLGKIPNRQDPYVRDFFDYLTEHQTTYTLTGEQKDAIAAAGRRGKRQAKEFGQLLHLQGMEDTEYSDRRIQWEKIIEVRPEDAVRFFREKEIYPGDYLDSGTNSPIRLNSAIANSASMQGYINHVRQSNPEFSITGYDDFNQHFGADISYVREYFLKKPIPELVKFANMREAGNTQRAEVLRLLTGSGSAEEAALKLEAIIDASQLMQRFLLGGSTLGEYRGTQARERIEHINHQMHDAHDAAGFVDMVAKQTPIAKITEFIQEYEESHEHLGDQMRRALELYRSNGIPQNENQQDVYLKLYHEIHDKKGIGDQLKDRDWEAESGMRDNVHLLLTNIDFMDAHVRAQAVDDLFSGELQDVPANSGLLQLHAQWTTEQGQDALARAWGDGGDVYHSMNEDVPAFLTAEGLDAKSKAAEKAALRLASANGQNQKADLFKALAGKYVKNSLAPIYMQVIGQKSKLWRQPANRTQEIWGPTAPTLDYGETQKWMDHYKSYLVGYMEKEMPSEQKLSDKERAIRRHHRKHDAEKWFLDLRDEADNETKDLVYLRLLQALFVLVAVVALEGQESIKKSSKELAA